MDHQCRRCKKTFNRRFNLDRHEKSCKVVPKPKVSTKCPKCQKTLSRSDHKNRHLRTCKGKQAKIPQCDVCRRKFKSEKTLANHKIRCVSKRFLCEICGDLSETLRALNFHKRVQHDIYAYPCDKCDSRFTAKAKLTQHCRYRHPIGGAVYECEECSRAFSSARFLNRHVSRMHREPSPEDVVLPPGFRSEAASFGHYMVKFVYEVDNPTEQTDVDAFFTSIRPGLKELFGNAFNVLWQYKFLLSVHMELEKNVPIPEGSDTLPEPITDKGCYNSDPIVLTDTAFIDEKLDEAEAEINKRLDHYQQNGSSWNVTAIFRVDVHMVLYRPIRGGCTVKLDKFLESKKRAGAIRNIDSPDQKCFLYSVLAALHPDVEKPGDYKSYDPYLEEIDWEEYPMSVESIPKFAKMNDIQIFLYGYENSTTFPLKITDNDEASQTVFLLMIKDKHFLPILNFNSLIGFQGQHSHFCFYCCLNKGCPEKVKDHMILCKLNKLQRTAMPKVGENTMKFTNVGNQLIVPYVILADFECILSPISSAHPNPAQSYTHPYQRHIPCGMAWAMVSQEGEVVKHRVYRGSDCVDEFLTDMQACSEWFKHKLDNPLTLDLSPEETDDYHKSTVCHICQKPFNDPKNPKVRDHCHLFPEAGPFAGSYRGAAHNTCNQQYRLKKTLPVFFHNLKNYDQHLIVHALPRFGPEKVSVIAQTSERYISMRVNDIVFLDSLNFLGESLEKLAERLNPEQFETVLQLFDDSDLPLLTRKGVFPYEHVKDWAVFDETKLPPREAFYSSLTNKSISEEDYEHAKKVWDHFDCQTMGGLSRFVSPFRCPSSS